MSVRLETDLVVYLLLGVIGLGAAFFAVRPEIWRRVWGSHVDPRPAALMRIAFGLVVLVTFVGLLPDWRVFFTDEGMFLTDMARSQFGGPLKRLWDPEHGFEHWWGPVQALLGKFTILHLRSGPGVVMALLGLLLLSLGAMIVGFWTRTATVLSWLLVHQINRYEPIYYTGADFVIQVFLFLGMLTRWGEAYSVDSWRRRRAAVLAGAPRLPGHRLIPAWPVRLMMVQLAVIYCATGLLKYGETWASGVALYYALNLDHFYRVPAQAVVTWVQYLGVLPVMNYVVRWWEMLFPLALIGAALRGYEADHAAGRWPETPAGRRRLSWGLVAAAWLAVAAVIGLVTRQYGTPAGLSLGATIRQEQLAMAAVVALAPLVALVAYRWLRRARPGAHRVLLVWVLGKRTWLTFGLSLHLGINLGVNVGTFAEVMMVIYFMWLSGPEVDALWRFVRSHALAPGEGARPIRRGLARLLAPLDALRHRAPAPPVTVWHAPDETAVRRAALLRLWAPRDSVVFAEALTLGPGQIRIEAVPREPVAGAEAGLALVRLLPGLWWLRPWLRVPGLERPAGRLVARLTGCA